MSNRSIRFAVVLALAATCTPALASATEYFVNNTVSSSGSGSSSSPFKTIQEGLNRAGPGDVVTVRGTTTGRTYNETPDFPTSGTSSGRITLRAYPGEKVILTGSSGTRLTLDRNYITVDGLTIDQGGGASDAVKVRASNIIIQKCEIRNGEREGISVEQTSALTIQDCSIHDFMWIDGGTRIDAHGIMISGSSSVSGVIVQRNIVQRCSGDGCQIFGETGQDIATYAKNISFLNNTFIDGTTTSGQSENALDFKAADGVVVRGNIMRGYHNNKTIVVQKGCRNISIEDNVLSDGLSGIEMRQEGGASFIQLNQRIVGNVIYNMETYALKFDGVKGLVCANNTLANIGDDSFRFTTSESGYRAVDGAVIQNNITYKCASAPSGVSLVSGLTANHNGWFQASAGSLSGTGDKTGSSPGFTNESTRDYRLIAGSPCIDAGVVVGRPFSGAAPDLGAYEFGSGADLISPAAVTDLTPY